MSIAIISATKSEIQPTLNQFVWKLINENHYQYKDFSLFVCGVGLLETAYQLSKICLNHHFDHIIQVGIAGTYNDEIDLGDVVEVVSESYGDLGAEDIDRSLLTVNELELTIPDVFKNGQIINDQSFVQLKGVSAISVNLTAGSHHTIEQRRNWDIDIESMEGLALFRICKELKLNCSQIRSISNRVEPRNKDNWAIPLAIKQLNDFIIQSIID